MMKLRNLMQVACMATAALTAFSCSQEEFENSGRKGNITVNATFEGAGTDTRTTVNDEYKILWQDTDALGLFCSNAESNYSNTKLEYASGAGQTPPLSTATSQAEKRLYSPSILTNKT